MSALQILGREDYQRWLNNFGVGTKHIYINSSATKAGTVLTSPAIMQACLNCVHSKIFPMPCKQVAESTHLPHTDLVQAGTSASRPVLEEAPQARMIVGGDSGVAAQNAMSTNMLAEGGEVPKIIFRATGQN